MKKTAFIKLSRVLTTQVMRPMQDVSVDILGRNGQVLKITRGAENVYGVRDGDTFSSEIINNLIIQYPLAAIEMFDQIENTQSDVTSINLMDILKIDINTKYASSNAEGVDVVGLEVGDILVDVLRDEHDTKIPIKMEIVPAEGEFFGQDLLKRTHKATLVRGTVSADVEALIAAYIADFE